MIIITFCYASYARFFYKEQAYKEPEAKNLCKKGITNGFCRLNMKEIFKNKKYKTVNKSFVSKKLEHNTSKIKNETCENEKGS